MARTLRLASRRQGGVGPGRGREIGVLSSHGHPMPRTSVVSRRPMDSLPGLRAAGPCRVHVPETVRAGMDARAVIPGSPKRSTEAPVFCHSAQKGGLQPCPYQRGGKAP